MPALRRHIHARPEARPHLNRSFSKSDSNNRIEALETRIAYQDQTIEELNAAVTEQWALIEQLRR